MPTHLNLRYAEIEDLWPGVTKFQELAAQYGISDIFSDNGGKVAQLAIAVGLDIVPGRQGADACDRMGNEYELKTLDLNKNGKGFTTNHHLNKSTIEKYRQRRFVFALYEGITLVEAYLVLPRDMEPIYQKWLMALKGRDHLNNPKVPIDYVREVGAVMYLKDVAPPWMAGKKPAQNVA
jgi:hypothetical protein